MNFSNLKALVKKLPISKMTGQEKFLVVAVFIAKGKINAPIKLSDVKKIWAKSSLKNKFHPTYYSRAQGDALVDPGQQSTLIITETGLDHFNNLLDQDGSEPGVSQKSGSLIIFNKTGTHSFDKFLRNIFRNAKKSVFIADSYVDEKIFDNTLDEINESLLIKLIFSHDHNTFMQRAKRFKSQYKKFYLRKYKNLHDRFLIVDGEGYIMGPSIKDAAENSPALVIKLGAKESNLLNTFYDGLWKTGTHII